MIFFFWVFSSFWSNISFVFVLFLLFFSRFFLWISSQSLRVMLNVLHHVCRSCFRARRKTVKWWITTSIQHLNRWQRVRLKSRPIPSVHLQLPKASRPIKTWSIAIIFTADPTTSHRPWLNWPRWPIRPLHPTPAPSVPRRQPRRLSWHLTSWLTPSLSAALTTHQLQPSQTVNAQAVATIQPITTKQHRSCQFNVFGI